MQIDSSPLKEPQEINAPIVFHMRGKAEVQKVNLPNTASGFEPTVLIPKPTYLSTVLC